MSRPFPLIMGILNASPDSFFKESTVTPELAARKALEWEKLGVDILDIGGESTRPGSQPVSVEEELSRILPVLRAVREVTGLPISIDTYKPEVMDACADEGATWLNDISAFEAPKLGEVAAKRGLSVILMHKKGSPETMQTAPVYKDVVGEVVGYLSDRAERAMEFGIPREKIWLDPGIGFGKSLEHNLELLRGLFRLLARGFPVAVGLSNKRWIGELSSDDSRLAGSVTGALWCWLQGTGILRVHDVGQTIQSLKVAQALWKN